MKRLKKLRQEKKLYQKEVAKILGVSRQAYNRYELGRRNPDNTMLIELATLFDVSIDYLLGNTDIKKTAEYLIHEPNNYYDQKAAPAKTNTFVNIEDEYLKLAQEIQDAKIKPEDIRTIVEIIKRQGK